MTQMELALELTLALIEKGRYSTPSPVDNPTNEQYGEAVAQLYNTIYANIKLD
ncbi:MAG: hypothetical protein AB9836_06150 [Aminipila sp.]